MGKKDNARREIGALYGFRVLMTLLVANFHIWQQSWLPQTVTLLGSRISFDYITRTGYIFVDGLILLSGFLLFLPHAGCRREGTKPPSVLAFYRNRLWRILPSYLLAVLAAYFLFALPQGSYASEGARRLDLWSHLTLTQTFFLQPYYGTPLNGVLWTVCIEMQFYLLFPLLARWARKKPGLTLSLMMAAGWLYRAFVYYKVEDTAMYINQLPAFLDVYALGMLGAMGYEAGRAFLEKCAPRRKTALQWAAAAGLALCIWVVLQILHAQCTMGLQSTALLRLGQLKHRLPLALVLLGCILTSAFLPRPLEWLLGNRLMRRLSGLTFNFYIWHQFLAVQYVRNWFPNTLHSDPGLQWAFTVLCYASTLVLAAALTAVTDRVADWGKSLCRKRTPKRAAL